MERSYQKKGGIRSGLMRRDGTGCVEKSRKRRRPYRGRPLNVYQTEKILALISYVSVMIGSAAALLALALWYGALRQLGVTGVLELGLERVFAGILPFVGIVLFVAWATIKGKLSRYIGAPVKVSREAALLYDRSVPRGCGKPLVSFVLCCLGPLFGACVPLIFSYQDRYYAFWAAAGLTVTGAFCSALWTVEGLLYGRMDLSEAEDAVDEGFDRGREIRNAVIRWSIYWIVVLAGYSAASIAFKNFSMYAFYLVPAALNFVLRLMINRPYQRFSSVHSRRITVRILNSFSFLAIVYLYLFMVENGFNYNYRYIRSLDYSVFQHDSSYSYDQETGVYTLSSTDGSFRILQLTDLHICGSISTVSTDRKAFDACYSLIKETQPDLIVITGDLVYPIPLQTFNKNNLLPMDQICTFMDSIGIPWTMVYGNHDTESVAAYSAKELSGIFRYYQQKEGCPMLYSDRQPDVYGRYNQYLRIENADGSLNRLIFLIDSNDYIKGSGVVDDYDSVHEDQIAWYKETIDQVSEEEGRIVPSFVFMHIPPRAFADAQKALAEKDPDAVYLFGENAEQVSCPDRDLGFFQAVLEKRSTEGIFVGHDHLNNMGIKYKGVDLVYSKSIDYYAYPGIADRTEQRGATLITLAPDGTYSIEQVDYDTDA